MQFAKVAPPKWEDGTANAFGRWKFLCENFLSAYGQPFPPRAPQGGEEVRLQLRSRSGLVGGLSGEALDVARNAKPNLKGLVDALQERFSPRLMGRRLVALEQMVSGKPKPGEKLSTYIGTMEELARSDLENRISMEELKLLSLVQSLSARQRAGVMNLISIIPNKNSILDRTLLTSRK